jgi:pyruvate dehydrogenase E1 component
MNDNRRIEDIDPLETQEWREALEAVRRRDGTERVQFLLQSLQEEAEQCCAALPTQLTTAYVNTIPPEAEAPRPGNGVLERRIKSLIRWNAMAMVVRANQGHPGLGGHIASYASAATLYEIGLNYFFRAPNVSQAGDIIFYQGHAAPGLYAHAFLEGRLTERDLENFRREVATPGLSSYPHPRLMPEFWSLPTVSMGLGPIMAIYQARFMRYLENREVMPRSDRKVWAFLGDGEMDEPESTGAISLAAREKLDNLVFVVNCNLQRLDGPVRGNGKVIQELEALFRGAGWRVIKVVWGSNWDPLLARDGSGKLRQRMMEAVDGDYQTYVARGGNYVREHFFGTSPELRSLAADLSDTTLWQLKRGGHDPQKVYAAYAEAVKTQGQPVVILAKTVKGYGLGTAGEAQNIAHQQKMLDEEELLAFRDRFDIPLPDEQTRRAQFYRPPEDSVEIRYLKGQREKLGGPLPQRRVEPRPLAVPGLEAFKALTDGSKGREISTTMAFVRALTALTRDKELGRHVVPIVADEARTFGLEGAFRQLAIYAPEGQKYEPVDAGQLAYYREENFGQLLQEGITEAGAFSSWAAAGTSHINHGLPMVPFFIFYSMFGFQRIGDLIWAAADMRARGFLVGATAGRTTLNGEGLQHQDGHSHLLAATVPSCVAYDPAYGYEVAVILEDGLRRMYRDEEDVFYYLTTTNENYAQPPLPAEANEGILKGMYLLRPSPSQHPNRVQLLGSGAILREVIAAAELLEANHSVAADVWSVTSFNELGREGQDVLRWNRLHPDQPPRQSYVEQVMADHGGPVVASTDYQKAYAEQIRPFVKGRYVTLGTDGFGRSDTRESLRSFFEVDRYSVTTAALWALAQDGAIEGDLARAALEQYDINPDKPAPARS